MNYKKKIIPLILATTIIQTYMTQSTLANTLTDPHPGVYGYYVDTWKDNTTSNMMPATNPAIGVLSEYLKLWTPGSTWNNGTVLNSLVHNANIQKSIDITKNRTDAESHQTYLDDRRDQNYSITDGLGKYTNAFRDGTNAGTTIPDEIPKDATEKKYDDKGNNNGNWADTESNLGSMVNLINTMRNTSASTTSAKNYFQYQRPWRWSNEVQVLPTLVPAKSTTPEKDGGFPSGHTNAATIAAIGLAYATPERFQEMLTRASELGNNRIVAGMHSSLDVIGGRVMATAIATAALNNPNNQSLKEAAYNDAHTKLLTQNGTSIDRFSNYSENRKNYNYRLTYNFPQIGSSNTPMKVPKGAEVLLETRLPYLDGTQRREVLYTTGIKSGYPVIDDAEGYGRLNLFAAADGYGALLNNVEVNMDASKGGFNAMDSWRNDIYGTGSLTKKGTGTLKLVGNNTYTGGTEINNGTIEADSITAFGTGKLINNGGRVTENVSGQVIIGNEYAQSENSTLELNVSSNVDILKIEDKAKFGGILKLNFSNGYVPTDGATIISYNKGLKSGEFSSIAATGLPKGYTISLVYNDDNVSLKVNNVQVRKVNSITVSGENGIDSITTNAGRLQMRVNVNPENADNKSVTWSVSGIDGKPTDIAKIDDSGILTAEKNGSVNVVAAAKDGSGITGQVTIVISGQIEKSITPDQETDKSKKTSENENSTKDIPRTGNDIGVSLFSTVGLLFISATLIIISKRKRRLERSE
ncbi:phosphatase PAP2 family protein [Clostridium sp. SHJSY1]|uniref:acid phosphatase n=1 Tax=Clostridium sp. SHJSY1 TaxID=2942483 RepID=UPI0028761AD7|nr:phosphatase PAP2 family protein [Clostridium sp. SHJSY1]MDS0524316.1 phosphatase PAP2 family protein [Clostridium sp. SHJSY1]